MLKKAKILKWGTVAVLGSSLILFLCPYVFVDGANYSPIKMLEYINEHKDYLRSDSAFEITIGFVVPVILTALSALIMALKTSIPKVWFALS